MCAAVLAQPRRLRYSSDLNVAAGQMDIIISEVRRKYAEELIRKHQFKCAGGRLSRAHVVDLLADLNLSNGTPPTDEEAEYILSQCHGDAYDGSISIQDISHALELWHTYCKVRGALQKQLLRYDSSHSGKMDRSALKRYLQTLNHGEAVADDTVDQILQHADGMQGRLPQDGFISSPAELALATSAWYEFSEIGFRRGKVNGKAAPCCSVQ
mmetsp:Transcript_31/g.110  ORF Transcript_31/g.110 Transcript_31/m.110 type:complete len:212 (-) Transcript_31:152-787(-)